VNPAARVIASVSPRLEPVPAPSTVFSEPASAAAMLVRVSPTSTVRAAVVAPPSSVTDHTSPAAGAPASPTLAVPKVIGVVPSAASACVDRVTVAVFRASWATPLTVRPCRLKPFGSVIVNAPLAATVTVYRAGSRFLRPVLTSSSELSPGCTV